MAQNTLASFSFSLFLLSVITCTSARNLPVSLPPAKAPETNGSVANSTEFIRSSCQATLYPDLCFASLSRYSSVVRDDPVRLARVAARVTFSQINYTKARVASYLRGPTSVREASCLKDCVDSLGNAADQTKRSASEIAKLDHHPVGTDVAWRVSNAQTWMSAALTNEETCTDGFNQADPDRIKADVCDRVGRLKQYTSNTLALVNSLVNG